jgi:hypothetical protein
MLGGGEGSLHGLLGTMGMQWSGILFMCLNDLQETEVLDQIIERLLEVKMARPGKLVPLTEAEVSVVLI